MASIDSTPMSTPVVRIALASKQTKPAKPHPDFPLYAHSAKVWAKRILGKVWYFGPWDDHQGALEKYLAQKDTILAGRDPRKLAGVESGVANQSGCTVVRLVNTFLTEKENRMLAGRLSRKMFSQYREACKLIVDNFGKESLISALTPHDFANLLSKFPNTWGISMIGGTVGRIRSVFLFASESDLIDKQVKFGPGFARPSKLEKRRDSSQKVAERGRLDFSSSEVRLLLDGTKNKTLKACIYLGLNAGFGNTDCAELTTRAVNLDKGWIDFPRPKTGIERRVPLWPETVSAIRNALSKRTVPNDAAHDSLVFLSREGNPLVWDRITKLDDGSQKYLNVNNLTLTFGRLLTKLKLRKSGHNFYSLRRTFETVAGASKDQVAVDMIMGHEDGSMAAVYRQGIEDARLIAVTDHVRNWLFPDAVG